MAVRHRKDTRLSRLPCLASLDAGDIWKVSKRMCQPIAKQHPSEIENTCKDESLSSRIHVRSCNHEKVQPRVEGCVTPLRQDPLHKASFGITGPYSSLVLLRPAETGRYTSTGLRGFFHFVPRSHHRWKKSCRVEWRAEHLKDSKYSLTNLVARR